ncbi:MAG: hypothetical protein NZ700_01145 [Gemmataceae bacterium]|nr:hypothetical protein [Gemmataceae bacterium]MDW8264266.1 hypothetical protein [Gemmataceae bacterium]
MRYLRSYLFFFDHPYWFANLLLGSLCQLIPVVGFVALLGQGVDLLEDRCRRGRGSYQSFDIERFPAYLRRGLWPFVRLLVIYLPFVGLCSYLTRLICEGIGSEYDRQRAIELLLALGFSASAVFVLLGLVVDPWSLRSALGHQAQHVSALRFVCGFVRRVWIPLLLARLFGLVTAQVALLVGLCFCGLGIYPALVLIVFAHHHRLYQLYQLYLQRGGPPLAAASAD